MRVKTNVKAGYSEPDTGLYVVNGDELVETEQELVAFY
jgi:hypothetical protein